MEECKGGVNTVYPSAKVLLLAPPPLGNRVSQSRRMAQAACWKRRFHVKETAVSPDEVMSALKRYLENTGDTERAAALKMGVNRHTLCRWLSDEQSPKKGKMALAAFFPRQAGYL